MSGGAIVAIDGPAGAGKSTAARRLAGRFGYVLIDTGALYRAVALLAKERDVAWEDEVRLGKLAASLELRFEPPAAGPSGRPSLFVDGEDRSTDIRRPDISQGASQVSAHPAVRSALLEVQRSMARGGGVVLEGRDIGTVVFPSADVKVFLTASTDARARRRHDELVAGGAKVDLAEVKAEMEIRDTRDTERAVAPLRPADDATMLDTSDLGLDEVVDRLAAIVRAAGFAAR